MRKCQIILCIGLVLGLRIFAYAVPLTAEHIVSSDQIFVTNHGLYVEVDDQILPATLLRVENGQLIAKVDYRASLGLEWCNICGWPSSAGAGCQNPDCSAYRGG